MSKQQERKSTIVEVNGNGDDSTDGFTQRLLMSMLFDVTMLAENVEQIKVKVYTLAKEHGIVPPAAPGVGTKK